MLQALPTMVDQLQEPPLPVTPRLKHPSSSSSRRLTQQACLHSSRPSQFRGHLDSDSAPPTYPAALLGLEVGVKVWTVVRGQPLD